MSYPATADLVAASSVGELTALTSAQQAALRDEAIAVVEEYCNQSFTAEGTAQAPALKVLDGPGGPVLYLPRRLEVLVSLRVTGATLDDADLALSADGARLVLTAAAAAGDYYTRALEIESPAGFGTGLGSIEVSGAWGWSACPAAVAAALRLHMEDRALADANALAPTVRSSRNLGVGSVSQGSLSATLDADEPLLSARARRQLAGLVWEGAGGFVA